MTHMKVLTAAAVAALAVSTVAVAQKKSNGAAAQKKSNAATQKKQTTAASAQQGKLFPTWSKPLKGTYAMPHGELGMKPSADQPWTVTTMASSIEGKPLKGKPFTVVGEILDMSCYLQVGKHGEKHRDCGQKCLRNGQPVGLLAENGTLYWLIDEEHDPRRDGLTAFRQAAVDHMAHIMTVHGTYSEVNGQKALYVSGYVKQ